MQSQGAWWGNRKRDKGERSKSGEKQKPIGKKNGKIRVVPFDPLGQGGKM